MKREIKFRAWDKINRKFYYFTLKDIWSEGCETQLIELNDTKRLSLNTDFPYNDYEQFTGLKDKNGVEIYEGDILRFPAKDKYEETTFNSFEVFFHDNDCCDSHIGWQMNRMHTHGNSCGGSVFYRMIPKHTAKLEIIGNIHTK